MMNDAPDSRLETLDFKARLGRLYYLKNFEKHDIEVSITAWFSHAMPLKQTTTKLYCSQKYKT